MNNTYLNQFKANRSKNLLEISYMYCTDWHTTASVWSFSQLVSNQGSTIWNKTGLLIIMNAYQNWRPTKWKYKEESTANCYVNRLPFMDCTTKILHLCATKLCSAWGRTGRDNRAFDSSGVLWFSFYSAI